MKSVSLQRLDWAAFGPSFQMKTKDGRYKTADDVLSMPDVTLGEIVAAIQTIGRSASIVHKVINNM